MKKNYNKKLSHQIDLVDTLIIVLFFMLTIIYAYGQFGEEILNFYVILSVMIGCIIGYYTNITIAILYSILFNFAYASLHIFVYITQAIPININVYFWMIVIPLFAIMFALKGKWIRDLQMENLSLKKENNEYVMVDKETGLRNSQSFFSELQGYMNINKRYGIIANLMLVKVKYENEVVRIIGMPKFEKIITLLSSEIDKMLREEDRKYILRDSNMFGVVFLTQNDDGEMVKDRLKNTIRQLAFHEEEALIHKMKLEIMVGLASFDQEKTSNAYEFFQMAEKDMEYDV